MDIRIEESVRQVGETMEMVSRSGIAVIVVLSVLGTSSASAQIEPYTPPVASSEGGDWTERITEILPEGVETRSEVRARRAA